MYGNSFGSPNPMMMGPRGIHGMGGGMMGGPNPMMMMNPGAMQGMNGGMMGMGGGMGMGMGHPYGPGMPSQPQPVRGRKGVTFGGEDVRVPPQGGERNAFRYLSAGHLINCSIISPNSPYSELPVRFQFTVVHAVWICSSLSRRVPSRRVRWCR